MLKKKVGERSWERSHRMLEDYTGWSELSLLNPDMKRGACSQGISPWGQCTFSLGEAPPELSCLCNSKVVFSPPYLAGMDLFPVVFTTCSLLGACCDCWLLEHQKETKQISKQQNLARAKSNSQSLSWTYSKQGKKTEAYKNAFCLHQRRKPRHHVQKFLCMDETLIPTCARPAGQGRLALGSWVPEKWSNNLPCFSIQVSPASWSLESSNRFPQPWQQFYAWV